MQIHSPKPKNGNYCCFFFFGDGGICDFVNVLGEVFLLKSRRSNPVTKKTPKIIPESNRVTLIEERELERA